MSNLLPGVQIISALDQVAVSLPNSRELVAEARKLNSWWSRREETLVFTPGISSSYTNPTFAWRIKHG